MRIIIKVNGKINKLRIRFTKKFPFTKRCKAWKSELEKIPKRVGIKGKIKNSVVRIKRTGFLNPWEMQIKIISTPNRIIKGKSKAAKTKRFTTETIFNKYE